MMDTVFQPLKSYIGSWSSLGSFLVSGLGWPRMDSGKHNMWPLCTMFHSVNEHKMPICCIPGVNLYRFGIIISFKKAVFSPHKSKVNPNWIYKLTHTSVNLVTLLDLMKMRGACHFKISESPFNCPKTKL